MNSMDLVLTLVFSVVMLLFMSYPAMRVSEWLQEKAGMKEKWHTLTVISLTILFSLAIGIFLRYA
ncbi:hypothetical protein [Nitratifractor sp.]